MDIRLLVVLILCMVGITVFAGITVSHAIQEEQDHADIVLQGFHDHANMVMDEVGKTADKSFENLGKAGVDLSKVSTAVFWFLVALFLLNAWIARKDAKIHESVLKVMETVKSLWPSKTRPRIQRAKATKEN